MNSKKIFLATILGLNLTSSSVQASDKYEEVSCDDLAKFIRPIVADPVPRAFWSDEDQLVKMLVYHRARNGERLHITIKTKCAQEPFSISDHEDLKKSSTVLAEYTRALRRCVLISKTPTPLALQLINELDAQKKLNDQCADEYLEAKRKFEEQVTQQLIDFENESKHKLKMEQALKRYMDRKGGYE